jgi:uncharacterized protein
VTVPERTKLGWAFYAALLARDWSAIRGLLTDDATWSLPGNDLIPDPAIGADSVVARAEKIAGFGGNFTLMHILISQTNVALFIQNAATCHGRTLNGHLATVCHIRDRKIAAIETYLTDVGGMNTFLV